MHSNRPAHIGTRMPQNFGLLDLEAVHLGAQHIIHVNRPPNCYMPACRNNIFAAVENELGALSSPEAR